MIERVLVVFEPHNDYNNSVIFETDLLKDSLVDIKLIDEIKAKPNTLNEYKAILDCTQQKTIMNYVSSIGFQLKDKYQYYKANETVFLEGIQIQHIVISKGEIEYLNDVVKANKNSALEEHKNRVNFLKSFLNPETTFAQMQDAISKGLEIHNNGQGKKYVLVNEKPKETCSNTEYILAGNIPFLKDVLAILEYIKKEGS